MGCRELLGEVGYLVALLAQADLLSRQPRSTSGRRTEFCECVRLECVFRARESQRMCVHVHGSEAHVRVSEAPCVSIKIKRGLEGGRTVSLSLRLSLALSRSARFSFPCTLPVLSVIGVTDLRHRLLGLESVAGRVLHHRSGWYRLGTRHC